MRLDKYLKISRLIKRRTVANEACDNGRVTLNGRVARASAEVKPGDIIGIAFGNRELSQAALVEEYLPGREYTVMVIGNGPRREILPGRVTVDPSHYGRFPILRSDLRGVGLTHISIPEEHAEEAKALAAAACDALACEDHVRIDMREGADGRLRIMEVNGIPGLKPVKSWSPQIFALYHPGDDPYRGLVGTIVSSAWERANGK